MWVGANSNLVPDSMQFVGLSVFDRALAAQLSKPCLDCLVATLNEIQFTGKEVRFEATDVSFLRKK